MNEFGGTQGEWNIVNDIDGNCFIKPVTGAAIVRVYTANEHSNESKANAQLIAAAPELLEALQELLTCHETYGRLAVEKKSKAAINKALTIP